MGLVFLEPARYQKTEMSQSKVVVAEQRRIASELLRNLLLTETRVGFFMDATYTELQLCPDEQTNKQAKPVSQPSSVGPFQPPSISEE